MTHMKRFEHGGDVYAHPGVVDFSANINPLGMPACVIAALREHAGSFDVYPDAECRELCGALSRVHGVPGEFIVCTAGASDLLQRVCWALKPKVALVTAPCFSGYEQAIEQAGARVERHELAESDGFNITESILDCFAGTTAPDIVFLCNPNNPTGLTIDRGLLERVFEAARARGCVVVVDECFLDFTHEKSVVDLCAQFPHLIVMRAFTKLYAMAGLRLGYGICSDGALVTRLHDAGQPWAVSTPAQVAGIAALSVAGWAERTRDYVDRERVVLAAGLEELGMHVVPGAANYLMFKSDRPLYDELLELGFLIRRCENYQGLDKRWYRIAVRTTGENEAFLQALREVCS